MLKQDQSMKFCKRSTVNGVVSEKINQKRRSYEKI
jgi:hypothetical protein